MLILLPPSETKAPGGEGSPLDLAELSFADELTRVRERVLRALVRVSAQPRAGLKALGLTAAQRPEMERNIQLEAAPTMPALQRYTGVLFDSLDAPTLSGAERERAYERLAVGSALFGIVRAGDQIPAYRLSASAKLPRISTLAALWKPKLGPVLAREAARGLVVDLRSGAYQALAPVPGAVTVRVLSEAPDGSRSVVSHFNKATKGRIARQLAVNVAQPIDSTGVVQLLRDASWQVEEPHPGKLDVIIPPL